MHYFKCFCRSFIAFTLSLYVSNGWGEEVGDSYIECGVYSVEIDSLFKAFGPITAKNLVGQVSLEDAYYDLLVEQRGLLNDILIYKPQNEDPEFLERAKLFLSNQSGKSSFESCFATLIKPGDEIHRFIKAGEYWEFTGLALMRQNKIVTIYLQNMLVQ